MNAKLESESFEPTVLGTVQLHWGRIELSVTGGVRPFATIFNLTNYVRDMTPKVFWVGNLEELVGLMHLLGSEELRARIAEYQLSRKRE